MFFNNLLPFFFLVIPQVPSFVIAYAINDKETTEKGETWLASFGIFNKLPVYRPTVFLLVTSMPSNNNIFYDGFRTFSWLQDLSGVPLDKINFVIVYIISLALAGLLRSSLNPEKVKPETRHAFCISFGLILGYFCYGKHAIHLIGFSTICYGVIITQDPKFSHIQVFIVAMLYLFCVHLHSHNFNYGTYTLDVSGPIMMMTGKVTSLACSLHDGIARPEKELTHMQKKHVIKERPSILEYYSYLLSFLTLMAGPVTFYDEYIDFIHNRRIQDEKLQNKDFSEKKLQLSINSTVLKKVCLSITCLLLSVGCLHAYDIKNMADDRFLKNTSMFYQIWYLNVSTSIERLNYYFAWIFVDAICNNAGFGFNGFDENGQARWTLVTNINIWEVETATNMNGYIKNWNKVTIRWLKLVVYERVPRFKYVSSFLTSTVWHGFNPGYYLSMMHGIIYFYAALSVRRHVRPYFLKSKVLKCLYDLSTVLATRIAISYFALSFIIFEFQPAWKIYRHLYFLHVILPLIAVILLPILLPLNATITQSEVKNDSESSKNRVD